MSNENESSDSLSEDEVAFAVSAGVPASAFSSDGVGRAHVTAGSSRASAAAQALRAAHTTREVAERLGIAPANVRHLRALGDIYAVGRAPGGETLFAAWQFIDDQLVPGLRPVLSALPSDLHPLDVEQIMTQPIEALDGRSPVQWLASGGPSAPVAAFVASLSLL